MDSPQFLTMYLYINLASIDPTEDHKVVIGK